MLAYDTEITGLDLWHGCRSFFFSFCSDLGQLSWCEWNVNPFTRIPEIIEDDLLAMQTLFETNTIVGHNVKIDLRAFELTLLDSELSYDFEVDWCWDGIEDSLVLSHVFRNLWGHSLKSLRKKLLRVSTKRQDALREATNRARAITRTKAFREAHGTWRIADARDPHWPAVKKAPKEKVKAIEGWWLMDTWLPRTIARLAPEFLPEDKPFIPYKILGESNAPVKQDRKSFKGHRQKSKKDRNSSIPFRNANQFYSTTKEQSYRPGKSDSGLHQPNQVHSWWTVLRDYGLEDAETTILIYLLMKQLVEEAGLWGQYQDERRKLIQITYEMETEGLTLNDNLHSEIADYRQKADSHTRLAVESIPNKATDSTQSSKSSGKEKDLKESKPKEEINLNSSPQLQEILFERLDLPVLKMTAPSKKFPKGQASTDADVIEWLQDYVEGSGFWRESHKDLIEPAKEFLSNLISSRRSDKARDDLEGYSLWSHPLPKDYFHQARIAVTGELAYQPDSLGGGWDRYFQDTLNNASSHNTLLLWQIGQLQRDLYRLLHVWLNITGTGWTRQSSNSPNLQNVGTGKEQEGFDELLYNLRVAFGPPPGFCWIDRDYSNLELRLWAYDCGNKEFIKAYEDGYSVHMLIFRELWPQFNHLSDEEVKKPIPQYKWTKNGDFSIPYGAGWKKADETYKVKGAYDKIVKRFPEVRKYTESLFDEVRRKGYIDTMTGYRLYVPKDAPHKAVSARIQGTAGNLIGRAMIACHQGLRLLPETKMSLQVHDSLVFTTVYPHINDAMQERLSNFPFPEKSVVDSLASKGHMDDWTLRQHKRLLLSDQIIKDCMEKQGDKIGIPTPTDGKLILSNWSEGEKIQ